MRVDVIPNGLVRAPSRFASAMLASARPSVTDDSTMTMKSLNSTSWLFGSGVPRRYQTPSANLSASTRAACGAAPAGAWRFTAAFGCDVGDVQLEHRIAALLLHDPRRELHAAEVAVVGVGRLDRHVAQRRLRRPRLDLLDEMLRVDVAVDLVLVPRHERDDGQRPPAGARRRHRRLRRQRGPDESLRRQRNGEPPPHAEFSPAIAAPAASVYRGWPPPPRGGFSNCVRVVSSRDTPFSKSIDRAYFA